MSDSSSPSKATAAFPDPSLTITSSTHDGNIARPEISPTYSDNSSTVSSSSDSEQQPEHHLSRPTARRSRSDRSRFPERTSSIITARERGHNPEEKPDYPPDDARAMSPRRSSEDVERLEQGVRQSLKEQARTLQSSLAALAEKIDEVKSDHDKLENENRFLQDYIGGLTRTMSKGSLGRTSTINAGKKKGKR